MLIEVEVAFWSIWTSEGVQFIIWLRTITQITRVSHADLSNVFFEGHIVSTLNLLIYVQADWLAQLVWVLNCKLCTIGKPIELGFTDEWFDVCNNNRLPFFILNCCFRVFDEGTCAQLKNSTCLFNDTHTYKNTQNNQSKC